MRSQTITVLVITITSIALGCGGGKTTNLTPNPQKDTIKKSPDWFLNPPSDTNYLFSSATATSQDYQLAIDKAQTIAKRSLSQQMGERVGNLTKQFQEEIGSSGDSEILQSFSAITKTVTQHTLMGVKTDKREMTTEKGVYRAYVLMSLPIGEANRQLMENIKANKALLTKLRATEAFKELERELTESAN